MANSNESYSERYEEAGPAGSIANAAGLDPQTIREHKVWFWGGGALFLLVGGLAIFLPHLATLGATFFVGGVFAVTGVMEMARAFKLRGKSRIAATLLFGLVGLIAGVLLLLFPLPGALTLTTVVAALFLVGGGLKTWHAFQLKPLKGWGWTLFSGVTSLALAVLIILAFPASAVWTLGLLLGVDLIAFGASLIALSTGAGEGDDAAA
ncbi:MAG: HdeD family acid-resistance protein [Marivibrio sp.]|uniref:HdeD family acid-resistance protein n=1 Tax=Marivibrio sp. TaxID=2039719 RepID=UPI0032EE6841